MITCIHNSYVYTTDVHSHLYKDTNILAQALEYFNAFIHDSCIHTTLSLLSVFTHAYVLQVHTKAHTIKHNSYFTSSIQARYTFIHVHYSYKHFFIRTSIQHSGTSFKHVYFPTSRMFFSSFCTIKEILFVKHTDFHTLF